MTVPVSALQSIAPSAIIELFELQLNEAQHGLTYETYRFHAGTNEINDGDVIWAGNTYLRFPVEVEGFQYNGQGQLPRPKLRISNVLGTITALLLTLPNGLEGAKVTRIRTLARYLDAENFTAGNTNADPTAEFPLEIYYIDRKAAENREIIEFELASAFDLAGVRAPKRQCISNICQWVYRGSECGYGGNAFFNANNVSVSSAELDVCGKRLSSCELRFGTIRTQGAVTTGSAILTLLDATSVSTGASVSGFGIPNGTTVSSYSGLSITLSASATATTTLTTTGTLQTSYNQIIVTNATGLSVGMTVTGNYLAANTQVVAIAGTTVMLGTPADVVQFLTAVGTFISVASSGINFSVVNRLIVVDITGATGAPVSVGQYIASDTIMPLARLAKVVSIGNFLIYPTVTLDTDSNVNISNLVATWTLYTESIPASATYTFTATNQNYTFTATGCSEDSILPYGSFPGIGAFSL